MSWVNLATTIYPIGAYYLSHTSTSPATLFGGTWSALTDRFLYCNANNNTGGSNTHTLTVNEMPAHNHKTSNGYHGTQWGMETHAALGRNTQKTAGLIILQVPLGRGLRTTICQLTKRAMHGEEQHNSPRGDLV